MPEEKGKGREWMWHIVLPVALLLTNLFWLYYVTRTPSAEEPAAEAPQGFFSVGEGPSNKVALLIGNGDYKTPPNPVAEWKALPNPKNDVALVRDALAGIGFSVTVVTDADWQGMQDAIARFAQTANGADVALFYYAGHGFEFDRRNYLVPVNAPVQTSATGLAYNYVPFELAANALTTSGTTVFMIDACRTVGPTVSVSDAELESGLAAKTVDDYDFPAGKKVAVLYSTARGIPAKDGVPPAKVSPFAAEVARNIVVPRVELTTVFSAIRKGVYDRTRRYKPPQAPYTYNSLDPEFFLTSGASMQVAAGAAPAADRGVKTLKPLAIDDKTLATTDENVLAVQVLADHSIADLKTLAERKDPQATYLLGYMYEFGVGVEKDIEQARDLLERAAKLGTPSGQLELAYFLQRHPKAVTDKARSLELFRTAANTGFAKARAHYASVLMTGALVPNTQENYDAGLAQLRLAAKSDYPYAMYALALQGKPAEQRQWRSALEKLAVTGDADAHHWLCEIAMDGRDYTAAQRHCTIAATAGYADAQARLALAAFNGLGRRKSLTDALHWMRQALSDPALEEDKRAQLLGIQDAVRKGA